MQRSEEFSRLFSTCGFQEWNSGCHHCIKSIMNSGPLTSTGLINKWWKHMVSSISFLAMLLKNSNLPSHSSRTPNSKIKGFDYSSGLFSLSQIVVSVFLQDHSSTNIC